ncbi:hypothetical protein [Streptomyces hypolithicus]
MSTATLTRTRDPRELLNALASRVPQLITGDEPTIWDREIALLTRDNPIMTTATAERLLEQAVAYMITAMERPGVDMGVGYTVDQAVHAIILDTPLMFAFCDVQRRRIQAPRPSDPAALRRPGHGYRAAPRGQRLHGRRGAVGQGRGHVLALRQQGARQPLSRRTGKVPAPARPFP